MDCRAIKPVQDRVRESADDAFACLAQQHREGVGVIDHSKERSFDDIKERGSQSGLSRS